MNLGVNFLNEETINEILKFRDERDWKQYHNPKDLAISINIEAAELLENFQWSTWQEVIEKKKDHVAEELADVLIYCVHMADTLDLDIEEIVKMKLKKNAEKYPVEKSYGKKDKYTEL